MTFLQRTFFLHPLAILGGLCMISLTIPSSVLLWREQGRAGVSERIIHEEGTATRQWLTDNVLPLARSVADNANGRIADIVQTANQTERDANSRLAEVTATAKQAV